MGAHDHRDAAAGVGAVRVAIIIVSDSRTPATDESGALARRLLEEAGHQVVSHGLLPNDEAAVRLEVSRLLEGDLDLILTSGGTGVSRRDRTVEAVSPLLEKRLDGFGEFFRRASEAEIGTAAMMSRALAGAARGKLVVCLPGSRGAVRTGLERVLLPELRHLIWELRR